MSTPANATEAPSVAKVWRQLKDNAPTFVKIWILLLIAGAIHGAVESLVDYVESLYGLNLIRAVTSLPTVILDNLVSVLITAVPAIYYATGRCPESDELVGILARKPLRYVLGGVLFFIAGGLFLIPAVIGSMFNIIYIIPGIIPSILVVLVHPLYVHYVFTTDLNLITCLSKAFKGMFQDFGSYFLVSLLCFLAIIGSIVLCIFPFLAVLPMTELYMQNYIHHKGLVRAR